MLWALLAAYLTKRPAWVQAVVFGLCAGLFVTAAAESRQRSPAIGTVLVLVVGVGVLVGGAFYLGLRGQLRRRAVEEGAPGWVQVAYVVAWLLAVAAAVAALFGEGGFTVAVLAIVPIVLLAPPALVGLRRLMRRPAPRRAAPGAAAPPETVEPHR